MKDFCVYITFEPYIVAWLTATLGNPVRFPRRSAENALLTRCVSRRPPSAPPEVAPPGAVAIVLPDNAERRPEFYNYIGKRGRADITAAVDRLFRLHLWSECAHLIAHRGELNRGIDEWCAQYDIPLAHREAVRQKFYRMRKEYQSCGIALGKKYKKQPKSLPLSRAKSYKIS